jgi:hypothetical protein
LESKISRFLQKNLLTPVQTARTNGNRLQRRLGGGRMKKTAKQLTRLANGVLDALGHLFHGGLLQVTVTLKVTVTCEPDLNKNFFIHTGTKKLNNLRGTTRFVGRDTISRYHFTRCNGLSRR